MNKVILMGRPTADPEVRYAQGENAMAIARFTLAVVLPAPPFRFNNDITIIVFSFHCLSV